MTAPASVLTSELPALSVALPLLFRTLAGTAPDGRLAISGRSQQGVGQVQMYLPVQLIEDGWIPAPVLERLEEDLWSLQVALAVRDTDTVGRVHVLHALVASWSYARVYRNERGQEGGSGSHHVWPIERLEAAIATAEGFAVPPTLLIRAAGRITALWALSAPIDVGDRAQQDAALARLRRLAAVLGADVPGEDLGLEDLDVILPGSLTREPEADIAVALVADPSCRYDLAQIDAALEAPAPSPSRTVRATKRSAPQPEQVTP